MTPEKLLVENFKLGLYEARVYVALTKGSMTPREIAAASQVPLPRTYDTLRSLQAKGFVQESGPRFSAISTRAALEGRQSQFETTFSKEKLQRDRAADELVRILRPSAGVSPSLEEDAVLLRGINSIASKFREVLSDSKDVILVVKKAIDAKELFKRYLEGVSVGGGSVRILCPRNIALTREDLKFVSRLGLQVRWTDGPFIDLMVADDGIVMIGVPDPLSVEQFHSIAVMITSRRFATSVRESLESLWAKSYRIRPRAR